VGNVFNLSAIVLAAGLSRRAAPNNKLLLPFGDTTVIRSTVSAMCAADFREVIVVTGHEQAKVEDALRGLNVRLILAETYAEGMGASLASGVRASIPNTDGLAVVPGDLPHLSPELVCRVAKEFVNRDGGFHVVPTSLGERGHPVIIGNWLRSELCLLNGDVGARVLLASEKEKTRTVYLEVGERAVSADVDLGL
jgi:molybdenum cofactor cytidylyltransferase